MSDRNHTFGFGVLPSSTYLTPYGLHDLNSTQNKQIRIMAKQALDWL